MEADYSQEAIIERDPAYVLPCHHDGTDEAEQTMTLADAFHWERMVELRPALRCLRAA